MNDKISNSDETDVNKNKSKVKDPRNIITPDAFTVADSLLGLPLASPKRRAAAMGLDLVLIQQLSQIGSMVLGLSIAAILFLLSRSKGRKSVGTARKSVFSIMAIGLFLYVVAMEGYQYIQTQEFSIMKPDIVVEESSTETEINESVNYPDLPLEQQLSLAKEQIVDLQDENNVLRADDDSNIIDLVEAMATKFGYGFGWAGVYFTLFVYLLRGQTPGKFIFRIQIIQLDGQRLSIWNSFGRYGGYAASVVTGLSGFFQIFWDANRQGLHDKVASTVVVRL
ncbi:MAG: RDD family protein [Gammaproteobacteria bacterium]|nr:RDD family protein [Gammaproteobacteria bacterium]